MGALVSLSRFEETGSRGQLALATLQAVAVPFFKVFLGAHLLLGLGVALLLARWLAPRFLCWSRRRSWHSRPGCWCSDRAARRSPSRCAPLDLVQVTRETLGLAPVSGLRLAGAASLWLLLSLGLRLAGIGEALARPARSRLRRGDGRDRALGLAARSAVQGVGPRGARGPEAGERRRLSRRAVGTAAVGVRSRGPRPLRLDPARGACWPPWRCCCSRRPPPGSTPRRSRRRRPTGCRPRWCGQCARSRPLRARATWCCSVPGAATLRRPSCSPADGSRTSASRPTSRSSPRRPTSKPGTPSSTASSAPRAATKRSRSPVSLGASFLALYGNDRVRFDAAGVLETVHEEAGGAGVSDRRGSSG